MSDRLTGPKSRLQAQQTKRRLRELAFSFLGILDGICHKKGAMGFEKLILLYSSTLIYLYQVVLISGIY